MGRIGDVGGVGPLKLFDGATATSESGATYDLEYPVRHFSLQVQGTTGAEVTLKGGLSTAGTINLIAWSSDTSGSVLSTESTGPISRITASFEGGASSGTPMTAWFSATP